MLCARSEMRQIAARTLETIAQTRALIAQADVTAVGTHRVDVDESFCPAEALTRLRASGSPRFESGLRFAICPSIDEARSRNAGFSLSLASFSSTSRHESDLVAF
jgi:hypothetical protein